VLLCSEKYLTDNERIFEVSLLVSSEEDESNESVFSHSEWMKLQVSASAGQQHEPRMHPITTRSLFQSQSWKQSEEDLSKIFQQLFALAEDPDQVLSAPPPPPLPSLSVCCDRLYGRLNGIYALPSQE
jgi:hypothetical protein